MAHKVGNTGMLGTLAGIVGGAIGANALEHKAEKWHGGRREIDGADMGAAGGYPGQPQYGDAVQGSYGGQQGGYGAQQQGLYPGYGGGEKEHYGHHKHHSRSRSGSREHD